MLRGGGSWGCAPGVRALPVAADGTGPGTGRPLRALEAAMEEVQAPASPNPCTFPARLWRLVNSPRCCSIRWDARGERLLVEEPLFLREALGAEQPGGGAAAAADLFRAKRFASFVRQLHLCGFRKVAKQPAGSPGAGAAAPRSCTAPTARSSAASAPSCAAAPSA